METSNSFFVSFGLPMTLLASGVVSGGVGGFIEGRSRNTGRAAQVVWGTLILSSGALIMSSSNRYGTFLGFAVPMISFMVGMFFGGLGGFIEGRSRHTGGAIQVVAFTFLFATSALFLNTKFHYWW